MNAKDLALVAEMISAATAPLIEHINAMEQRTSNFAARVNASNKIYRAEIARLRDEVAALTPVKALPMMQRISPAEWDAAMVVLRKAHPGKSFFAPSEVRGTAARMHEQLDATAQACRDEDTATLAEYAEDEEVSL